MIKIVDLDNFQSYHKIKQLWNEEIGFIFPITEKVFNANVLADESFCRDSSFVAMKDNRVIGFIITKLWKNTSEIPEYQNTAWISLFLVANQFRRQGIGSQLLLRAEQNLIQSGARKIHVGRDLNNFFPGIPLDFDRLTPQWFKKRGYDIGYITHDLMSIVDNIKVNKVKNTNFTFKFATSADRDNLIEFMQENFSNRWAFEVIDYFNKSQSSSNYLIVLHEGDIIAFTKINFANNPTPSYNTNWYSRFRHLVGIGPLGVDRRWRKIGLGSDIVNYSLKYAKRLNASNVIIDWTGLLSLYQRFGFEVWKSYFYCSKKLED